MFACPNATPAVSRPAYRRNAHDTRLYRHRNDGRAACPQSHPGRQDRSGLQPYSAQSRRRARGGNHGPQGRRLRGLRRLRRGVHLSGPAGARHPSRARPGRRLRLPAARLRPHRAEHHRSRHGARPCRRRRATRRGLRPVHARQNARARRKGRGAAVHRRRSAGRRARVPALPAYRGSQLRGHDRRGLRGQTHQQPHRHGQPRRACRRPAARRSGGPRPRRPAAVARGHGRAQFSDGRARAVDGRVRLRAPFRPRSRTQGCAARLRNGPKLGPVAPTHGSGPRLLPPGRRRRPRGRRLRRRV